jgi:hypothetical protein
LQVREKAVGIGVPALSRHGDGVEDRRMSVVRKSTDDLDTLIGCCVGGKNDCERRIAAGDHLDRKQRIFSPSLPAVAGLGALQTGAQYQLFVSGPHEALGLVGLNATWAHTGRVQALGAPDFTTLSPTFDFGKGLGDLPRSLPYLRPFAITGNLGFDFPTKVESAGVPNPNTFNYGFAFEYSFPYLQCCVKDIGLRAPFNRLIPLVEVAFTTPINRVSASQTVGTIQPGVIWAGTYFQIGAEAILPATRLTGHGYGGVVQFHIYLDDLFPHSIGRPISEWW